MMFSRTSGVLSRSSEPRMASTLPCTSALITTFSSFVRPAAISPDRASNVTRCCPPSVLCRRLSSASSRAVLVLDEDERLARARYGFEAHDLRRHGRSGLADAIPPMVEHRLQLPPA